MERQRAELQNSGDPLPGRDHEPDGAVRLGGLAWPGVGKRWIRATLPLAL